MTWGAVDSEMYKRQQHCPMNLAICSQRTCVDFHVIYLGISMNPLIEGAQREIDGRSGKGDYGQPAYVNTPHLNPWHHVHEKGAARDRRKKSLLRETGLGRNSPLIPLDQDKMHSKLLWLKQGNHSFSRFVNHTASQDEPKSQNIARVGKPFVFKVRQPHCRARWTQNVRILLE